MRFLGNRSTAVKVAIAEELVPRRRRPVTGPRRGRRPSGHPPHRRGNGPGNGGRRTTGAVAQAPDITGTAAWPCRAAPIAGKAAKADLPDAIALVANPDILAGLNAAPEGCFKVGFALAADDGLDAALGKLTAKRCHLVVLTLADKGAGFGHDEPGSLRSRSGQHRCFELKSKEAVAADLADVIQSRLLQ